MSDVYNLRESVKDYINFKIFSIFTSLILLKLLRVYLYLYDLFSLTFND